MGRGPSLAKFEKGRWTERLAKETNMCRSFTPQFSESRRHPFS